MMKLVDKRYQLVVPWVVSLAAAACGAETSESVDYGAVTSAKNAAGSSADQDKKKPEPCDRNRDRNCGGGTGGSGGSAGGGGQKTQKLALKFKAKVGKDDFACNRTYKMGTKRTTMQPVDLKLLLQDIKLIRSDNTEVPVTLDANAWQTGNLALVDFEDATGTCAGTPGTNKVVTGIVPAGKYVGVSFTNGVPEQLNHGDPLAAPEPLKSADMMWGWLFGYRFTQIEFDQVVPAGEVFAAAWLHVGSTACTGDPMAGAVTCAKPNRNRIVLKGNDFDSEGSTITFDAAGLWADQDLTQDAGCHSSGDACPQLFPKVGVDFATGQPLTTQSAYKLSKD